ncbi:MAG: DNA topoisomerase IB [Gammaproteobacteria bacterium]|nr:MAG: DNA topoisomerase IB [Gammaproteobacteria bacterium]
MTKVAGTTAAKATATSDIKISSKKIKAILHDVEKSAKAINLVYVQDTQAGINRVKKGEAFHYYLGKKQLRDEETLNRIKSLVIPPAWENVWICHLENGHLQATGVDVKNRKQYKYHSLWNALRNQTKFYRLYEFGKVLPSIRKQLEKDLSLPGLPVEKVLALVVSLMEQTSIRVGNSAYEKLYGSFGLTTLKDKHVNVSAGNIQFVFKGKKGISHNISISNKRLAKLVKQCRDIPGKELFQYYDADGNHKSIDSGMVNGYLKAITGEDFTAKDFRTWAGTVHALTEFGGVDAAETQTQIKNNIVMVLDRVAEHLGNTRTVCKKYYVHPAIVKLYEDNNLHAYLDKLVKKESKNNELYSTEKLLMTILENEGLVCI